MKKILIFLLSATLFADSKDNQKISDFYGYGSFNLGPAPIPLPGFGLGLRTQTNHLGYDAHLQLTTIGYYSQLKWQNSALFYVKPNLNSQFYTGVGGSISAFFPNCSFSKSKLGLSPELTFGKSYLNEAESRRFMELQVSWPTCVFCYKEHGAKTIYFPSCVFSFGVGF